MKLIELLREAIHRLEEKLIILNQKNADSGNILFLAGGGGSGKGFALENFIRSESYKQFNVDDLKSRLVKIAKKKVDALQKAGKPVDADTAKLSSIDFKNADDVGFLHQYVKDIGIEDKQLTLFAKSVAGSKQKPNILFDMTFKKLKDATKKFAYIKDLGYEPKNVHVVWVLTDYNIALDNNASRSRRVPEVILFGAHKDVGKTLSDALFNNKLPDFIDGEFHIIFNNPDNSVKYRDDNGKDIVVNTKFSKKASRIIKRFNSVKVKEAGKPVDRQLLSNFLTNIMKALPHDSQEPKS